MSGVSVLSVLLWDSRGIIPLSLQDLAMRQIIYVRSNLLFSGSDFEQCALPYFNTCCYNMHTYLRCLNGIHMLVL